MVIINIALSEKVHYQWESNDRIWVVTNGISVLALLWERLEPSLSNCLVFYLY